MNQYDGRMYLSRIRRSRNRLEHININGNGNGSIRLPDNSTMKSDELRRYCRNYVRFRESSSRSRSRNSSKIYSRRSSIDYRKNLILLVLQIIALLHLCSVIYFHNKSSSFTVKYTIITIILFNILTYGCVKYDTQQVEHGGLLLGESSLLFLLWYGGIIGGGLALLIEKHKHLRSQTFTFRLKLLCAFNGTWLFIAYILYMYRNGFLFVEASGAFFSLFEALH
ncbi:unnamed protein product [Rotaria socialis]|uniref:Uncharacterized protein n=1 Tax=Rotaria socialis TaxID=392032 RepID=A0A818GA60_9BILA|nr:unnamed protein product [Rotaria socialis]CAF3488471.1 unnamed protein product [Rotaria socialis]CAF4217997.1 unnamed protein product [Rotaria socialis]CAF4231744.1 unnamed protein product [Rotaria socialis]